jgi:AcrR family transcriptional regulator
LASEKDGSPGESLRRPSFAPALPKWRRTRAELVRAARRILAEKGPDAASIAGIASEAGVTRGTFYNYFRTKDEAIEAAVADLVDEFGDLIATAHASIDDPAERFATGMRYFLRHAAVDPTWGWFIVRFGASLPPLQLSLRAHVEADIERGLRSGRFHVPDAHRPGLEPLIVGTVLAAMRLELEGAANAPGDLAVVAVVLRALGMEPAEIDRVLAKPLPPLAGLSAAVGRAGPG